jgi:hypothetical protein
VATRRGACREAASEIRGRGKTFHCQCLNYVHNIMKTKIMWIDGVSFVGESGSATLSS